MNDEMEFRLIVQFLEEAAVNGARILRKEGFKVYDLLESDIVYDSDGSKDSSVYVLCCRGEKTEFERFKKQRKFNEIMYEGFRTLM